MKLFIVFLFIFFGHLGYSDECFYNENIQKLAVEKYRNMLKEFTVLSDVEINRENFTYPQPYNGVYSIHSDTYGLMQYIVLNNEIRLRSFSIEPLRILKKYKNHNPVSFIKKIFSFFYNKKPSELNYVFLSKENWKETNCYRFSHVHKGKRISDDWNLVLHLTKDDESIAVFGDNGKPICIDKPVNIAREKAKEILERKFLEVLNKLSKDYIFHPESKKEIFFDLVYTVPSEYLVSKWNESVKTSDERLREKQEAYLSYEIEFQINANFKGIGDIYNTYMPYKKSVYTLETFPKPVYREITYSFFLRCDVETGKYIGGRFNQFALPDEKKPQWMEIILKFIAQLLGY